MEIEISSIIIGVIFLSTFFIPIFWYQISEKRNQKNDALKLKAAASEHNFTISDYDIWGNGYAIAIDKENFRVLFMEPGQDLKPVITLMALDKILHCRPFSEARNVKIGSHNQTVIDRTGIVLHIGKEKMKLHFFDGTKGKTLLSELELTQKWSAKLQLLISNTEKTV
jgi:hypothetical protein